MRGIADKVKSWENGEGRMTKQVEQQTAKIPSLTFMGIACGAIGLSLILKLQRRNQAANFVGLWVPTILLMGIYNKIVKTHGSE